jgi:hypothetical protein
MDNDRVLKLSCVISLVLFYVFTRAHHDTKRSDGTDAHTGFLEGDSLMQAMTRRIKLNQP